MQLCCCPVIYPYTAQQVLEPVCLPVYLLTFFFTFLTSRMRLAEISCGISASPFTWRSGFLLYQLPAQAGISFKKWEIPAAPSLPLLDFPNLLLTSCFLSPV